MHVHLLPQLSNVLEVKLVLTYDSANGSPYHSLLDFSRIHEEDFVTHVKLQEQLH